MQDFSNFHNSGIGHCNVAYLVHHGLNSQKVGRNDSTWIALQNNLGFALENALKAYLAATGISATDLKKNYGHDLTKLLDEVQNAVGGTRVYQDELRRLVTLMAPGYQSFSYRYLNSETVFVLHPGASTERAIAVIRALLDSAAALMESREHREA